MSRGTENILKFDTTIDTEYYYWWKTAIFNLKISSFAVVGICIGSSPWFMNTTYLLKLINHSLWFYYGFWTFHIPFRNISWGIHFSAVIWGHNIQQSQLNGEIKKGVLIKHINSSNDNSIRMNFIWSQINEYECPQFYSVELIPRTMNIPWLISQFSMLFTTLIIW